MCLCVHAEAWEPNGWSSSVSLDAVDEVALMIPYGRWRGYAEPWDTTDMGMVLRVKIVVNAAVGKGLVVFITKQTFHPVPIVQVCAL